MTLELEGLTKVYKDKTALDDVSFSFTPGIYGLLGPNGAGKSTMMNLISDNLTPSKGRVLLDGRGIDELEVNTGSFSDICHSSRIFIRSLVLGVFFTLWHP